MPEVVDQGVNRADRDDAGMAILVPREARAAERKRDSRRTAPEVVCSSEPVPVITGAAEMPQDHFVEYRFRSSVSSRAGGFHPEEAFRRGCGLQSADDFLDPPIEVGCIWRTTTVDFALTIDTE